jgi:Tripartite tricarboxylate transporter family receptor
MSSRVARAPPDGYTLIMGMWGTHVVNPAIYALSYDVVRDFEPILLIGSMPERQTPILPAAPAPVLDNERLGEREPHSFGQDARKHVERPACRGLHNYRDWTRRISLRARDSRDGRQRSDTRCQMQKSTAGKFHDVPLATPKLSQSPCL